MKIFLFHTNADYLLGLRLPLLHEFVRRGLCVSALAPNLSDGHVSALQDSGITGRPYSIDATGLNPVRDFLSFFGIWKLLRKHQPAIVLSNNAKPVIWATLAAALARIDRRYCLVGGLGYAFTPEQGAVSFRRRLVKFVMGRLYKAAFSVATAVIFQNADDRNELVAAGICPAGKAHVVSGSGVEIERYRPVELPPGPPVFVMVGRLVADKGVREYLQAARRVKQIHPDTRFLLVGQIDSNPTSLQADELAAYVNDGIVEWPGAVADVRPWLQRANIFVLPSYREGVPRSTLEAMACGLAVITTDAPGCRETVDAAGSNGILVRVRDVVSLVAAMQQLICNPEQRAVMGRNSRAYAERRFDTRIVNNDMARIMGLAHQGADSSEAKV